MKRYQDANYCHHNIVWAVNDKKHLLGAAGFIRSQLTKALINDGFEVFGIDSFDEALYPSKRRMGFVRALQEEGLESFETDENLVEWSQFCTG